MVHAAGCDMRRSAVDGQEHRKELRRRLQNGLPRQGGLADRHPDEHQTCHLGVLCRLRRPEEPARKPGLYIRMLTPKPLSCTTRAPCEHHTARIAIRDAHAARMRARGSRDLGLVGWLPLPQSNRGPALKQFTGTKRIANVDSVLATVPAAARAILMAKFDTDNGTVLTADGQEAKRGALFLVTEALPRRRAQRVLRANPHCPEMSFTDRENTPKHATQALFSTKAASYLGIRTDATRNEAPQIVGRLVTAYWQ